MNTTESLIRALWLTDNSLLNSHVEKHDLKLSILSRLKNYRYLDERTCRDAVDRVLAAPLTALANCQLLNNDIFELHQGLPVIRFDLHVQDLCRIVCPDSLLCLHENLPTSEDRFDWAAFSFRDGHGSNSVLNAGSIDTHIHLGGTLPPLFYWLVLMSGQLPVNVVNDLSRKLRGYAPNELWQEAITEALRLRFCLAYTVQKHFNGQAFPFLPAGNHRQWQNLNLQAAVQCFAQMRDKVATFSAEQRFKRPVADRCWPFWDALRDFGNCHYASGERRLLLHVAHYLRQPNSDRETETQLWNYLRIKNAFHQLLIHDHGSEGLMRFMESFSRRGFYTKMGGNRSRQKRMLLQLERSRMKAALDMQLSEAFMFEKHTAPQHKPIRRIEMRVSLTENHHCLRTINAWLEGIVEHVNCGKKNPGDEDCYLSSQVGLVFHLLKHSAKPHQSEQELASNAYHTARKLTAILKDYPRLRAFAVGLDVAGDERNTPPRIYCQAYDEVRREQQALRPKNHQLPIRLGWTYHVGEDYADLLTALRHLDEVSCLLFADDGGRFGHALALADSPVRFYQHSRRCVELSLGAHLLDLVWAHGQLSECTQTAHLALLNGMLVDLLKESYRENKVKRCYQYMGLTRHGSGKLLENELLTILGFEGNSKVKVNITPTDQWLEMVAFIQQQLRQRLAFKRLCIEANPTSNLIIGGFAGYRELPYKTLVDARLAVSLNTDDPGLFVCSLPGEFAAMYQALAEDGTMSHREILKWLDDRVFDAQQSSFLGNQVPIGLRDVLGLCALGG